jgi:hypothetical protein
VDYANLKNGVKEAEQIRRSVYSIMRQEQRGQQPRRGQGIDRESSFIPNNGAKISAPLFGISLAFKSEQH